MSGVLGVVLYAVLTFACGFSAYILLPRLIKLTIRAMARNAVDEASGMQDLLKSAGFQSRFLPALIAPIASGSCLIILSHFGLTFPALCCVVLSMALLAAAAIDVEHHLLPDLITLPLIWAGLLLNITGMFTSIESAVIGAAAGYGALFLISRGFYLLTKRVGMGDGDLKLLAVIGAWGGWQILPATLLAASVLGICFVAACLIIKSKQPDTMIPFGPSLSAGGVFSLLYAGQFSLLSIG